MVTKLSYANHDEWLAIRNKYIGGSDAGAVIGLNPYKSAYALWAEKTGRIPSFEGNLTTKVGAYLEEMVAGLFAEETGKKVRRNNFTLVNDQYPFACANLDREVVGEKAFLEIKTTNSIPIMRQLRGTEFPEHYYAQCTHYLAVTGYEKCYLAVLINCREFKVYELERDENEINALMEAEKGFWDCVTNNTPPALDGSESTADALYEMYPNSDGTSVDLFGWESELAEYMSLTAQIKSLTALKDGIANSIKEVLKTAEIGKLGAYKVSYKTQERSTFDKDRYLKDHGANSLDGYFKVSQSRVFKVTEAKKK